MDDDNQSFIVIFHYNCPKLTRLMKAEYDPVQSNLYIKIKIILSRYLQILKNRNQTNPRYYNRTKIRPNTQLDNFILSIHLWQPAIEEIVFLIKTKEGLKFWA